MRRVSVFLAAASSLGGCTTTSFAPPAVNVYQAMGPQSLDAICGLTGTAGDQISDNVAGARTLIKNYLASYNCAMSAAANGRQWFEIPAFMSLIGATAAVALGAGPKVAFVGQSANSVFTAGKSYYAPQDQVSILRSAVDALTCVQAEASHINAYQAAEAANQEKILLQAVGSGGPTITVEQQYYDLVSSRLSAINSVAAQRLSQRGTFDAAGVQAQIQKASDDLKKANDAKATPPAQPGTVKTLLGPQKAAALELNQTVQLDIDVLQPKLDLCVARAKS